MPNPTIRDCAEADMPAITAIYAHHVLHGTASFEIEPPGLAEMTRRRGDIMGKSLPYLIAEQGSAVLGYAYAGPYRPRVAYADTVEDSIYIHPEMTGRGLGKHLLPALLNRCEALGLRQVIAVVGDSANHPSIRLHQHFGFRLVGTLQSVGFKFGRWLDSVLLQRTLGPGDTTPAQGR